jgi:hypothetical protein
VFRQLESNYAGHNKPFELQIFAYDVQKFVPEQCLKHMNESLGTANGSRLCDHKQKPMRKSQHKFRYSFKI